MQIDSSSLVPVTFPGEGGVTFSYERSAFALGRSTPAARLALHVDHAAGLAPERPAAEAHDNGELPTEQPSLGSAEELPNFMGFEDLGGKAAAERDTEDAGPAASPSPAVGLLDDYVSLGLIAPKSVAAPAAATPSRPPQLSQVPWSAALQGFSSPLMQLHQEIVEFCRYLAPSPEETAARQAAIDRVSEVVCGIWPSARVQAFGSFATGLYLPTSDLDAVVLGSGCTNTTTALRALSSALARKKMVRDMQVIAKARVPIIKFEEAESGYAFDVSFDMANGPEAAGNVRSLMDRLPPMRPLVMVLKVFLQQRGLNEVYSGGVGSYALLVMVAAFLQTHPSRTKAAPLDGSGQRPRASGGTAPLERNLGALLLDFFRLYGRALSNLVVGVACREGAPGFFSKRGRGFHNAERPYLLAVEDPNDPSNDLGKNSWNVAKARMAFDFAYAQLVAPAAPGESLLRRVVRLDPVLFLRAPPAPLGGEPPDPGGQQPREREQSPRADVRGGGRRRERSRSPASSSERKSRAERKATKHRGEERELEAPRGRKRERERERSRTPKVVAAPAARPAPAGADGRGGEEPRRAQAQAQAQAVRERGDGERPTAGRGGGEGGRSGAGSSGATRRHRERSASDDDLGGRGGGRGSGEEGGGGGRSRQREPKKRHKGAPVGERPDREQHGQHRIDRQHGRSHIRFD